jgi:Domain of unknown function (DUF1929)
MIQRPAAQLLPFVLCCAAGALGVASAGAQPTVEGEWSDVIAWGANPFSAVEAIHTFMLPTGKVMFWQTWRESIGLWDPATGQFSAASFPLPAGMPPVSGFNPFCSGHAWLADGRLMVAGGHIENNVGLERANIYDPFTGIWANNVPSMPAAPSGRDGRWYPSATTLGNGDILVLSGDMDGSGDTNPLPQIYEAATNSWRDLPSALKVLPLYPRTFLSPDGRVVSLSGYSDETELLDTSGAGSWTYLEDTLDSNVHNYGSAVMYEAGKIANFGGGWIPTRNVSLLDLNEQEPSWRYAGGGTDEPPADSPYVMAQPRRQNNATILADGSVLITGGSSLGGSGQFGFNDSSGQIALAEIWDPETEVITPVDSASSVYRGYHSTALLLPDGRVLVTGGNHDQPLPGGGTQYVEQKSAEIYSPPYLFKGDRPMVTSAPQSAEVGEVFFVETPDAASIIDALIVVPGAVTHAQNWTQRANHLDFAAVDGGLNITLPSNPNAAPPGYYMLFLVNENGVPSIAEWLRADVAAPSLTGDYNGNGIVDAADYTVWRDMLGQSGAGLAADGDLDLDVDASDYGIWKQNFGATAGSGAGATGSASASVPEPGTCCMSLLAIMALSNWLPGPWVASRRQTDDETVDDSPVPAALGSLGYAIVLILALVLIVALAL